MVEINRGAVAAWSGAVCGGAAAVAGVLATVEGPAWRPVVIGFVSLAVLALVVLLWTGLKPVRSWIRELMPRRQPPPMRALTNRWHYTPRCLHMEHAGEWAQDVATAIGLETAAAVSSVQQSPTEPPVRYS